MGKHYPIEYPIYSGTGTYQFLSDAGIEYEVRFGRREANLLEATINIGVKNSEFDGEEYVLTGLGEFYSIMNTVSIIIQHFIQENAAVRSVEFSGEPLADETGQDLTKRTRVFIKYARKIFPNNWTIDRIGKKVIVRRESI